MQPYSKFASIILIFLVLLLIFQFFFLPINFVKSRLGQALLFPRFLFQSFVLKRSLIKNISALQLENQSLLAQLSKLENDPSLKTRQNKTLLKVSVYSRYPSNSQNQLLINAGTKDFVKVDDIALASEFIFLGQISSTLKDQSIVRTIFDPSWEIPVKIGKDKVDGLYVGGHFPKITLISKGKTILVGDSVIIASEDLPFGLSIGVIEEVADKKDELFKEATLRFPYNVSQLNELFIQSR